MSETAPDMGQTKARFAAALGQKPSLATGALVLNSGDILWGKGLGAEGRSLGEVCFNTSMSGYQEILMDPSYAGQIITFTFPHIGNVGTNEEDVEARQVFARGCILRCDITEPSNFRAAQHLSDWLAQKSMTGIAGVDTRALTRLIRDNGAPSGVVVNGDLSDANLTAAFEEASSWSGLKGLDLAKEGLPSLSEFVAMYAEAAGRTDVDAINYYMAFSKFRMSAILQGVYKRSLDGNASSRIAGMMGEFAKTFAKAGLMFSDGTLRVN